MLRCPLPSFLFLTMAISAIISPKLFSRGNTHAFLVTIFDQKIRVVSPARHSPHIHVILKNETQNKVIGRVQTKEGRVIDYVNLVQGEIRSVALGHIRQKSIFYYPLAPSFQAVELVPGRSTYEIPEKK